MKFLNRLFTQLADTEVAEDEDEKISKYFVTKHAKEFIDLAFFIIDISLTKFVSNEIVSYAIRIISKTENIPKLFVYTKEHHEDIVFKYSIPLLKLTPLEIEEFNENPVSYIRNQFDISDTLNSAKNSGIDMVNYFVTYKEDEEEESEIPIYLDKYLNYCAELLGNAEIDFLTKESIMLSIGQLSRELIKYKHTHAGIEILLKNHVFPELIGSHEMLKARALWLYGEMSLFVTEPEHAIKAVEEVYKCLLDECLPVKVFAGTSLHKLSKIKDAKTILEPGIAQIIDAYLKAMQEIDQDELVNALEEMVNIFEDKIEPFAFQLVQQLNNNFKKVVKNDAEESGESVLTANGCICAIRRIIAAVSKRKDLLEAIEDEIYPALLFCMTPKGLDYIEDCLD
jgi:importin-7